MKLSELIKQLQEIEGKYGDLSCTVFGSRRHHCGPAINDFFPVQDICVITEDDDYNQKFIAIE